MNNQLYHPCGIWGETAIPEIIFPSAKGRLETEVCVVGAGFLGLSTAIELSSHGVSTIILESETPGWGASGRNGGQVISGLKYDPNELLSKLGNEEGKKAIEFGASTSDEVFNLIKKFNLKVPFHRNGWIQAAHNAGGLRVALNRAKEWQSYGVDGIEELSKQEIFKLLGTNIYKGGWLDPRGGALQPLTFSRELAKVARNNGVNIFSHTRVTSIASHGKGWLVKSHDAQINCETVIVCTNAYTEGLIKNVSNSYIAANSFMIATEILPENIKKTILCNGHSFSDTRRLLNYVRFDHEGRLLIGGRGLFDTPQNIEDWSHIEKVLYKIYPQVKGVNIVSRWFGRVAITQDFLPHIHEPSPRFILNIGCIGRGLALQTALGRKMAEYIVYRNPKVLPFKIRRIKEIPFPFMRRFQINMMVKWYSFLDYFR